MSIEALVEELLTVQVIHDEESIGQLHKVTSPTTVTSSSPTPMSHPNDGKVSQNPPAIVIEDSSESEDNNDTSVISLGAEDKILPKTDPGSSNGKRQTDADMQSQLLAVRARRSEAWKASGGPMRQTASTMAQPSSSFHPYVWTQLADARKERADNWRSNKKRHWTIGDLAEKDREELDSKYDAPSSAQPPSSLLGGIIHSLTSTTHDMERIGRDALELTNKYRVSMNKTALKWNNVLYKVACQHSKDMGDGKVDFSHVGFDKRHQEVNAIVSITSFAENIAYNNSSSPAKVAVNSWIKSEGHRKNLVSSSYYCAIGVYRNGKNVFYLTQLFAQIPRG